uniref:Uncharacterized protein n=1 Tax=Cacopsylla melanoneura TaxID=428564 RepID=A0A8D8UX08_9HEMI
MKFVFARLGIILLLSHQVMYSVIACFAFSSRSFFFFAVIVMHVSSAYITVSPSLMACTISFVYRLYRDGPRFVPWLTPFWLSFSVDVCSLILVLTFLFDRNVFSHCCAVFFMPLFSILLSNSVLSTTSKADVRSKNTVRTSFPWSISFMTWLISCWHAVAVEYRFLKPCCCVHIMLFVVRYDSNLSVYAF